LPNHTKSPSQRFSTPLAALILLLFAPHTLAKEQGISEIPSLSESSVPNLPEASSIANSAASSAVSSILAKSSSLAAASHEATSSSGAVPTNGEL
jgi:hypothetical protein